MFHVVPDGRHFYEFVELHDEGFIVDVLSVVVDILAHHEKLGVRKTPIGQAVHSCLPPFRRDAGLQDVCLRQNGKTALHRTPTCDIG